MPWNTSRFLDTTRISLVVPESQLPASMCYFSCSLGWTAALTSGFSGGHQYDPPISLKYFELSPPRSLGCAVLGVLKWEHEMHLFVWRPPHHSGSGHLQVLPGVKVCTFSPKVSPEFVTLHTCLSCICTYTVLPVGVFYCQERFILQKKKNNNKKLHSVLSSLPPSLFTSLLFLKKYNAPCTIFLIYKSVLRQRGGKVSVLEVTCHLD